MTLSPSDIPPKMTAAHIKAAKWALDAIEPSPYTRADRFVMGQVLANVRSQVSSDGVCVPRNELHEQWTHAAHIMALAMSDALVRETVRGLSRTMAYTMERWLHPERFTGSPTKESEPSVLGCGDGLPPKPTESEGIKVLAAENARLKKVVEAAHSADAFWQRPNVGWPDGMPDAFMVCMDNLATALSESRLTEESAASPSPREAQP